jgi:biopolymer transport protein ExbD
MAHEHPEPRAKLSDVKRVIRRKLKKHPEHEHNDLNIYPMMDMMTILLVFMIMNFATESGKIMQSAELELPKSISQDRVESALVVQISTAAVAVEGRSVVALRNRQVDPSQKQGGANGFLITPLLTELRQHAERLKMIATRNTRRPFNGDVEIVVDRRIPYRTLVETVYTCGQAEFKNVRFVMLQDTSAQ